MSIPVDSLHLKPIYWGWQSNRASPIPPKLEGFEGQGIQKKTISTFLVGQDQNSWS